MRRQDAWMGGVGEGRGIRRRAESSGVEVVARGLVEVEVRDVVRLGGVEGWRLTEELDEEIALGRSAGGREGRGFMGEIEVEEDSRDDGRIGQKREDLHLGAAGGTHERQHVVDAREQDGPADSGRGGANSGAGSRDMAGEAGVYPGRRRAGHALGPTECHDARPQPGPAGPPPTPDRSSWTPGRAGAPSSSCRRIWRGCHASESWPPSPRHRGGRARRPPCRLALHSGPSRSADIGRIVVTRIHGPGGWRRRWPGRGS